MDREKKCDYRHRIAKKMRILSKRSQAKDAEFAKGRRLTRRKLRTKKKIIVDT